MPRNYQKKTDYSVPADEILVQALKDIKISNKSVLAVAKTYKIPKSIMYRLVTTPAKNRQKKGGNSSSDEDRDFCKVCLELMPKHMNRNNSIECSTCDRPFHLKCVTFTGRFFTCQYCDSDTD